jgi:hypothetical protein
MNLLMHPAWQSIAAMAPLALGLALAIRGIRRCRVALPRPRSGSMHPLTWMRGFREALFGLALAGVGAAWLWHAGWLLALAIAIGGEETLETSIAVSALRAQQRTISPAAPRPVSGPNRA